MVKLFRVIDRRKAEPEQKRIAALFPNGDRAEIIEAIDWLKQQVITRHKENVRFNAEFEEIKLRLGISG